MSNPVFPTLGHRITSLPQMEGPDIEHLCLQVSVTQQLPMAFHVFYRLPHRTVDERDQFFTSFRRTLEQNQPHLPTILVGEFNAKLRAWNSTDPSTAEGKLLLQVLDQFGFIQLVHNTPTRYSATGRQGPSLLDLVITNAPQHVCDIQVLSSISDHCPVVFKVALPSLAQSPPSQSRAVPDYVNTDFDALRDHIWNHQ